VVGVFPNETSAGTLATETTLRSSEEWPLKRYLSMEALETVENRTHNFPDVDTAAAGVRTALGGSPGSPAVASRL
jgi:hypothetical protein